MRYLLKEIVSTLLLLVFLVIVGGIFVLMAVLLGKHELMVLVAVLLLACMLRALGQDRILPWFADFPLVGESSDILDNLHRHYYQNPPRYPLYYLLYPITGVFYFLRSQRSRSELGKYFQFIYWIVFICFVEGLCTTYQLSRDFGLGFALRWALVELVLIYFLCNFFAIPVMVSGIRLLLCRHFRRLALVTAGTLAVLGIFYYYFSWVYQFDNLIRSEVILEQRLQAKPSFVARMQATSRMFLAHHLRQYRVDLCQLPDQLAQLKAGEKPWQRRAEIIEARVRELNAEYRQALLAICPYGEQDLFYLTVNSNPVDIWGFVLIPVRQIMFFAFRYHRGSLEIYQRWQELPDSEQFKQCWNHDGYSPSWMGQLARVAISESSDAVKIMRPLLRSRRPVVSPFPIGDKNRTSKQPPMLLNENEQWQRKLAEQLAQLEQKWQVLERHFQAITNANADNARWQQRLAGVAAQITHFRRRRQAKIASKNGLELLAALERLWNQQWPEKLPAQELRQAIAALPQRQRAFAPTWENCQRQRRQCQEWLQNARQYPASKFIARLDKAIKLKKGLDQWQQTLAAAETQLPFSPVSSLITRVEAQVQQRIAASFVFYDQALTGFNFPRAIAYKFIGDHHGQGVVARYENKTTEIFGWLLRGLWLAFAAFMPFHVLLIAYSHWKIYDNKDNGD